MSISWRHAPHSIALALAGWLHHQPSAATTSRAASVGLSYKPRNLSIPSPIRQPINTTLRCTGKLPSKATKSAAAISIVGAKLQTVKSKLLFVRLLSARPRVPHVTIPSVSMGFHVIGDTLRKTRFGYKIFEISKFRNIGQRAMRRLWSLPSGNFIARVVIVGILMGTAFGLSVRSVSRPPRIIQAAVRHRHSISAGKRLKPSMFQTEGSSMTRAPLQTRDRCCRFSVRMQNRCLSERTT